MLAALLLAADSASNASTANDTAVNETKAIAQVGSFSWQLGASAPGLQPATTAPFGVLPYGIPYNLRLAVQSEQSLATGEIATPPVELELLDHYGRRVVDVGLVTDTM